MVTSRSSKKEQFIKKLTFIREDYIWGIMLAVYISPPSFERIKGNEQYGSWKNRVICKSTLSSNIFKKMIRVVIPEFCIGSGLFIPHLYDRDLILLEAQKVAVCNSNIIKKKRKLKTIKIKRRK